MFATIDNPFGTDIFRPAAPAELMPIQALTLPKLPKLKMPRAPKPLSHHVRNFLLS